MSDLIPFSAHSLTCPKCAGVAWRRHGVHFDHEYRCGKCGHTWDPNETQPVAKPTTVHKFRKGKVLGPDDVYVGRPSIWGNPWIVTDERDRARMIQYYEDWILGKVMCNGRRAPFTIDDIKTRLKGKRLFCWCHPRPCHADVLARLADS